MRSATHVNGNDGGAEDCDPNGDAQIGPPVLNHKPSRRQVGWQSYNVLEKVIPSRCEAKTSALEEKGGVTRTQKLGRPFGLRIR